MIPAVTLANTFILRFGSGYEIDHLKLQKLCYFADGWWLALRGHGPNRLCVQRPQVWKLGPVFLPVYATFANSFSHPITEPKASTPFAPPEFAPEGSAEVQMVDWTWNRYGAFDSETLSDMTHQPGTPWYQVAERHKFRIPRYTELPDEINRPYFERLAAEEGIF